MLPKLSKFEEQISLIENSGIQFLDFGFCNAIKTLPEGNFLTGQVTAEDGSSRKFPILLRSEEERLLNPARNLAEETRDPEQSLAGVESLEGFDEQWLPLAFYHQRIDGTFSSGPINWVRGRIKRLPEPDSEGNLFRLTLAVDTNISRSESPAGYLAPTLEDIRHGRVFGMVSDFDQLNHFALQGWVSQWVERAWQSNLKDRNGQSLPVRIIHRVAFGQDRAAGPSRTLVINRAPGEEPAENLRAAEVRFARFFNQTPMAIAAVAANGAIVRANAAFARLAPDALKGERSLFAGIAERDREALRAGMIAAEQGKTELTPIDAALAGEEPRSARFFISASPVLAYISARALR